MALTPKQQRFIAAYLVELNATAAYQQAGYKGNANVAAVEGHKLLRNPKIQAAIQERQQHLQQQYDMNQGRVVQELTAIGFSDLRHYCTWGPAGVHLEPSATLTPAHSRVVKQLTATVGPDGRYTVRIQLHDKIAALDKLGRHLGLYSDQDPAEEWGVGLAQLLDARQQLGNALEAMHRR